MWHLLYYRRLEATERPHKVSGADRPGALSLTPFKLLEHITGTEAEIREYYNGFLNGGSLIAAEIYHNGRVVERYIARDESINNDTRARGWFHSFVRGD